MAAEKTNYSHVALRMQDDETGQVIYYQASHTLVNEMSEAEFLAQEEIVCSFDFQVSDDVKKNIKIYCVDQLGKPYGTLAVFGLAMVQICKWLGIIIHNPFKEVGQEFVCSQFVASILINVMGIDLGVNVNDVTPVMLLPLVQKLPQVIP